MAKMLIDGALTEAPNTGDKPFVRRESVFRNWVTRDGANGFAAEPDRYHLYISAACPWSHRTMIMRKLKGLEQVISVTHVDAFKGEKGWHYTSQPGSAKLTTPTVHFLYEVYRRADPKYTGNVTVPVLWDRQRSTIVNNESADIMRMFNTAFEAYTHSNYDYYPPHLRDEIDRINEFIYKNISNGTYKAGFAPTQAAYEEAITNLFKSLDELDRHLASHRYLVGNTLTEADLKFFTTLIRFDVVYYIHFKICKHRIADYSHLSEYLRELYQIPGIAETVNMEDIKQHYYLSHRHLNPTGIIPLGPEIDFTKPHWRNYVGADPVQTVTLTPGEQ